LNTLGQIQLLAGDPDGALQTLRKADGLEPGNLMIQYGLGVAMIEVGQRAEGRSILQEVLSRRGLPPALRTRVEDELTASQE
jgi:predicted Zn-dependent protease